MAMPTRNLTLILTLTRELGLPCAHAPALPALDLEPELAPRACAEELGHTFLPCILVNLARAPSLLAPGAPGRPGLGSGSGSGPG